MTIDSTIKKYYDPQFLDYYENLLPKVEEAENELFINDPDVPEDHVLGLKYKRMKIGNSDIGDKFGLEVPLSEDNHKNVEIKDDKIISFDGKSIPVKLYRPVGSDNQALPVHFNFHGGGFIIGGLFTDANLLTHLCLETKIMIIDVDYRMCPEYAFPYPLFDSYAVLKHVYLNHKKFIIDPDKISCGGISAGGQISLGVAHLCRDNYIPLKLVLSNVPPVDNYAGKSTPSEVRFQETVVKYAKGPILNWQSALLFEGAIANAGFTGVNVDYHNILLHELDIRAHPQIEKYYKDILSAENFKGLARHVISTGECDMLEEAAREYAKLLTQNQIDVRYHCARGCPHTYLDLRNVLDKGMAVFRMMVNEINAEFSVS